MLPAGSGRTDAGNVVGDLAGDLGARGDADRARLGKVKDMGDSLLQPGEPGSVQQAVGHVKTRTISETA